MVDKIYPQQIETLAKHAVIPNQLMEDDYAILRKGTSYHLLRTSLLCAFNFIVAIGDARIVMIGEATHGTRDFYQFRADITKMLITKMGFSIVAVEGDWPDCYRVARFVGAAKPLPPSNAAGEGVKAVRDQTAEEALQGFIRFPPWMWRVRHVHGFPLHSLLMTILAVR